MGRMGVSKTPLIMGLVFYSISFVLCILAYSSGYWFESAGDDRLFRRLGLWEACFDGYEHTSDYIGKAYYGCWWVFHKEYYYIRDWILPAWFVGVQTLMTFGLVLGFVGMAVIPTLLKEQEHTKKETLAAVIAGLTTACIGIAVVVFGIMVGEDRTWMPRPDMDRLGWSFGCAVVSGFFAAFSCMALTVYCMMRQYELLPQDDTDYSHHGSMSTKKSYPPSGPSIDIPMKPMVPPRV